MFSRRRALQYAAAASMTATATTEPVCSAAEWPVNHHGVPFYDPVRSALLRAAAAAVDGPPHRPVNASPSSGGSYSRTWLPLHICQRMCNVLGDEWLRIRPDAVPVQVPTTAAVVPMLHASDLLLPHNVDVCSCMQQMRLLEQQSPPRPRSVVGSHFRYSAQDAMMASHAARRLRSHCWVTAEELECLGWRPKHSAAPISVPDDVASSRTTTNRSADTATASSGTTTYFNVQDIDDVVDFEEFFTTDRRVFCIETGHNYKPLTTVRMRAFFMNQGLLPSDPTDCTWKFAGTSQDIEACNALLAAQAQTYPLGRRPHHSATPRRIEVAHDSVPFVDASLSSLGISEGIFLAAQTVDPSVMVDIGRLVYLKRRGKPAAARDEAGGAAAAKV